MRILYFTLGNDIQVSKRYEEYVTEIIWHIVLKLYLPPQEFERPFAKIVTVPD